MLYDNMEFKLPLSPDESPVILQEASSYVERKGPDHCIYYGVPKNVVLSQWTLLATSKIDSLRIPSKKEISRFYQLNTTCIQQGDHEIPPPCTKPKLLAVSDINQNNKSEFWYTDPITWDTGLTIGEENQSNTLTHIVSACPGCD